MASRIATEFGGYAGSDHFGGDVSSIGKEALRDQSPISVYVKEGALQFLAGDQHIEAFDGRFRAECLNQHWFLTLADAAEKLEA